MGAYEELRGLGITVAPLSDVRPPSRSRRSQFSATFGSTIVLLWDELRHLRAKQPILELDFRERDLRLDGMPRADARMLSSGVVLSFNSKHGPLRYATGEYDDWKDNLRAIALSLQALRSVDRYGVSKRGEQYRGWKALPPSSDPADAIIDEQTARAFLDRHGGSFRAAAARFHPDTADGDEGLFRAAVKARDIIEGRVEALT